MESFSAPKLREEQEKTLATPKRRNGFLAKILFLTMDILYGRAGSFSKFKVLEIIARMPYQAWENVAYIAITHKYSNHELARRIFDRVHESRIQQDNEQWHLLILAEQIQKRGIQEGFIRFRLMPQILAFFYFHISWVLYVIKPSLSYRLNIDFEDHAEHEYMNFVKTNPQLEDEPFESNFEKDYGKFNSMADVFRQIGLDERIHKEESMARIEEARFR